MEKRILCVLLIIATILTATTTTLNPPIPTTLQTQQTPKIAGDPTTPPPQTEWSKTYGGTEIDEAYSVQQTSDGGYIVAGWTQSFGAGSNRFWLVKTDSSGNMQWNRTYGGGTGGGAYSVRQTSDGGYIMTGRIESFGAGVGDFWLVKTDYAGNQQWNKTYGGTSTDEAHSVEQTSDGGYIVAGWTESFGAGFNDLWLVKTDSAGNMEWNRTYGGPGSDYANSVQQTADGGYILAGYTDSFVAGLGGFWLVKTDSIGSVEWNRAYGGPGWQEARSAQQTADGGYIAAGFIISFGASGVDFWLVKTDSAGNHQWNKTYGGTKGELANSVQQTTDGGYILAGYTDSFVAGHHDFWLVKTDSAGNHQWNETFGGTGDDVAYSVQQTADGGYIAAGYTDSFGAGSLDFFLVKTVGNAGGRVVEAVIIIVVVVAIAAVAFLATPVLMKRKK